MLSTGKNSEGPFKNISRERFLASVGRSRTAPRQTTLFFLGGHLVGLDLDQKVDAIDLYK